MKKIPNHVKMFCKCISQLDIANTCVLCKWDALTVSNITCWGF